MVIPLNFKSQTYDSRPVSNKTTIKLSPGIESSEKRVYLESTFKVGDYFAKQMVQGIYINGKPSLHLGSLSAAAMLGLPKTIVESSAALCVRRVFNQYECHPLVGAFSSGVVTGAISWPIQRMSSFFKSGQSFSVALNHYRHMPFSFAGFGFHMAHHTSYQLIFSAMLMNDSSPEMAIVSANLLSTVFKLEQVAKTVGRPSHPHFKCIGLGLAFSLQAVSACVAKQVADRFG